MKAFCIKSAAALLAVMVALSVALPCFAVQADLPQESAADYADTSVPVPEDEIPSEGEPDISEGEPDISEGEPDISEGEPDISEGEPQPPEQEPEKSDSDVVGTIALCSRWSGITTTGHIWVYIENTTEETLRVGLYDLPAGEGLSLATFGFTRSDGFGIYYNMETFRNDKYCDDSCICITDDLTRAELDKVTAKLLISNQWNPIINCVFFACSIWNTAGDKTVIPFFYPPVARLQIALSSDSEPCVMKYQPPENAYKQRGNGGRAYLENVSQKSLEAK